jgi:prefoldin subunit 5
MGPERREKLAAQDDYERARQELDALLATSKRLMEEMQELARQSKQLAQEHAELTRLHTELVAAAAVPRPTRT